MVLETLAPEGRTGVRGWGEVGVENITAWKNPVPSCDRVNKCY